MYVVFAPGLSFTFCVQAGGADCLRYRGYREALNSAIENRQSACVVTTNPLSRGVALITLSVFEVVILAATSAAIGFVAGLLRGCFISHRAQTGGRRK